MITREIILREQNTEDRINVVILAGVHGNETHAVSAVYRLYRLMLQVTQDNDFRKVINKVNFVFNVNEYGLKHDERGNFFKNSEDTTDCNRIFSTGYLTVDGIKEEVERIVQPKGNKTLILDVHNSIWCTPCVLIDYDKNTDKLLQYLKGTLLDKFVRPCNADTIKKYANSINDNNYAYTVELPGMGIQGDVDTSADLLLQFIVRFATNVHTNNKTDFKFTQDYLPVPIFTKIDNGIVEYKNLKKNKYKKGEPICIVHSLHKNFEDGEIIKAPFKGEIYDVEENLYTYPGKFLFTYGKVLDI